MFVYHSAELKPTYVRTYWVVRVNISGTPEMTPACEMTQWVAICGVDAL